MYPKELKKNYNKQK